MSEKYYQEYGPISRRRAGGQLVLDEPPPPDEPPDEPPPTERSRHRRVRRRGRARRGRSLLGLLLLVLIGTGIFMALPYALNLAAGEHAMDGVSLQGQPIGGMSREQVRAMLEQRYGPFLRAPLTISFEGRSWTPTLQQLGARLDLDRLADDALAAGHRGGPIARVEELWAVWQGGGLDIAPRLSVDTNVLQAYLVGLTPEVEQPPRDAALSIAEGKVLPTAARPGRQVLVDATSIDILRALQKLEPQTVVLRTRTLRPMLDDAGLAQAVQDARAFLSAPLVLRRPTTPDLAASPNPDDSATWTWGPEKIAEFLSVEAASSQMMVTIDRERLERTVERLAQLVDSPSAEPRVAFRKGKLTIAEPGVTGWRLKQAEAVDAISATLHLPARALDLPVEQLTPQVTAETLPALGISEVVGEGQSSFAGSAAYRITNIKAGAARLNGVLIPPDAEFSFNTQLGAVDEANGFVQGYAVIGNRTQLEWGGGVCQDSTTVFRAAFWAGLPITERHGHPFYISWYDAFSFPNRDAPGMDATIFTGVMDLKFKNDTGHWLLMEAVTNDDAQVLTVRLYGTRPNRTVSVKGPQIDNMVPPPASPVYVNDSSLPAGTLNHTDHARRGMDIAVYRVITENGVQQAPELFFTRFKAWPDVFVRGTGQ